MATYSKINPADGEIPALTGIRGVAIILVIVVHCYYRGPDVYISELYSNFFIFGWTGVELFFVLSGFLITSILVRQREKSGSYYQFIVNRSARIVPLYFIILFLFLVVSFLPGLPIKVMAPLLSYRDNWYFYWLYLSNLGDFFGGRLDESGKILGPVWSLAIEQHFYILWPIVVLKFEKKTAVAILTTTYFSMFLLRIFLVGRIDGSIIYHFTLLHIDGLFFGSIMALLLPWFWSKRALAPLLAVLSLMIMVSVFYYSGGVHYENAGVQKYGYASIAAFYMCAIFFVLTNKKKFRICFRVGF